jgi:hypothetical protein
LMVVGVGVRTWFWLFDELGVVMAVGML